jgi:hypothetical protein
MHKKKKREIGNFILYLNEMPRHCKKCHGITPVHRVSHCPHCGIGFESQPRSSTSSTIERILAQPRAGICQYKLICGEYLSSLKWQENYFDRSHNRCYCSQCYPSTSRNTYEIEGSTYVVPRGWCRFGLRVDQVRSQIDHIWKKWIITYHGTSPIAAQSIVAHRQFLIPGDTCIDGSMIRIRPGHIKDKHEIYTSPTIAYSSHSCYCPQEQFRSKITNKLYYARVVLQCRQKPGAFTIQGETIGAGRKRICQFIPNDQIEFLTTIRSAIVAYGLLIQLTEI